LSAIEQLVSKGQATVIVAALIYAREKFGDLGLTLHKLLQRVDEEIDKYGLDILSPNENAGHYERPRLFEIAAAFNRFPKVKMLQENVN